MKSEFEILQKTAHPNIMRAIELLEDKDYFYIVTELLEGGELYDRLSMELNFSEVKAAYIIK